MNGNFKTLMHDSVIRFVILGSALILLLDTVVLVITYFKLPPFIPFMNSLSWGAQRLFPTWSILFIPGFSVGVFIFNFILATLLYKGHPLASRIILSNTIIFILLAFLAHIQILLLAF